MMLSNNHSIPAFANASSSLVYLPKFISLEAEWRLLGNPMISRCICFDFSGTVRSQAFQIDVNDWDHQLGVV